MMTPTLLDVYMLTDLNITSSLNLSALDVVPSHKFESKTVGEWKAYIQKYKGRGSVTDREHAAFLMMWLDHFLFCGVSVTPPLISKTSPNGLRPTTHCP